MWFLRLLPILCGVSPGAILALGLWLAVTRQSDFIIVAFPLSVGMLLFALYAGLCCKGVLEGRWIRRRLRREVRGRADALIDPADRDVACMSLISRSSLESVWYLTPSDVMLVQLDETSRRLLIEGDENR